MRILIFIAVLVLTAISVFGAFAATFHAHQREDAKRATELLRIARAWRIGRTDGMEIQPLATQYKEFSSRKGYCDSECTVKIWFDDWPEYLRGRIFWEAGIRPSHYGFYYEVKNGKLVSFGMRQWTLLPSGEGLMFGISQEESADSRTHWAYMPSVTGSPARVLYQAYSKDISDADWERILRFNYECAAQFRPCREMVDYMPQAVEDLCGKCGNYPRLKPY